MTLVMNLRIDEAAWNGLDNVEMLCQSALGAPGISGEVDVLLTNDKTMHQLNADWRNRDKPTDVLSFPAEDPNFLGDIAIGYDISLRDAKAQHKPLEAHLSHLLIHGLLHLAGHDHQNHKDAERMEALERDAMLRLGYGDPYSQAGPAQA